MARNKAVDGKKAMPSRSVPTDPGRVRTPQGFRFRIILYLDLEMVGHLDDVHGLSPTEYNYAILTVCDH